MKLGKLREYVTDVCLDMADGKAVRTITRHVNAALHKVASAHDWSFLRDRVSIGLEAATTGVYLSVVQGSSVFALDSAQAEFWLGRYAEQGFEVLVATGAGILFKFDPTLTPANYAARMTQEWVGASASPLGYTLLRGTYPLPAGTSAVAEVMLSSTRQILVELSPSEFDFRKHEQLSTLGDPTHFTIRGDSIEVWPVPESASVLLLARKRVPARVTDASPDTLDVDWPDRLEAILLRAIDSCVVEHSPRSTQLDPGLVGQAWLTELVRSKETDGQRQGGPTQFKLGGSLTRRGMDYWAAWRSRIS